MVFVPRSEAKIFDVNGAAAPELVATFLVDPGSKHRIEHSQASIFDSQLYVASVPGGASFLNVFDLTDIREPIRIWRIRSGSLGSLGWIGAKFDRFGKRLLQVNGDYGSPRSQSQKFYMADIEISDPTNPQLLANSRIGACQALEGLTVVEHFALLDCGSQLELYDVRQPGSPIWKRSLAVHVAAMAELEGRLHLALDDGGYVVTEFSADGSSVELAQTR
jgi:hypothetical protein